MKEQNVKTKNIVMIGMFAAVLAVLSQISIPMPSGVPITLQTFAVALAGCVLGWKMGLFSAAIYILIGSVGVPVFASFSGGLGILFGKTGGFIFGFLPLAALCGVKSWKSNKIKAAVLGLCGLLLCHILGILQFKMLSGMGITESALLVSAPYLIKDIISVGLAFIVGQAVKKPLHAANILTYAKEV